MPEETILVEEVQERHFGEGRPGGDTVPIDLGRGQVVNVPVGSDFVSTIERLSDQANYGGYYRVFLNGVEVVTPEDSPSTIQPGMRIALTSYDKVG